MTGQHMNPDLWFCNPSFVSNAEIWHRYDTNRMAKGPWLQAGYSPSPPTLLFPRPQMPSEMTEAEWKEGQAELETHSENTKPPGCQTFSPPPSPGKAVQQNFNSLVIAPLPELEGFFCCCCCCWSPSNTLNLMLLQNCYFRAVWTCFLHSACFLLFLSFSRVQTN